MGHPHPAYKTFFFLLITGELKGNASICLGWVSVSLVHQSGTLDEKIFPYWSATSVEFLQSPDHA